MSVSFSRCCTGGSSSPRWRRSWWLTLHLQHQSSEAVRPSQVDSKLGEVFLFKSLHLSIGWPLVSVASAPAENIITEKKKKESEKTEGQFLNFEFELSGFVGLN